MKKGWIFFLPLALSMLLSSCGGPRYVDFFPVHDNGVVKPHVVLMPVKAPENCRPQFDKEIYSDIRYVAMDRGDLYLFPDSDVRAWRAKHPEVDIFGRDISWVKAFKCAEFVALVEAIDMLNLKYPCGCNKPYAMIKLRLKIIDVRGEEPKVIWYELLENCKRVPYEKPQSKNGSADYGGEHSFLVEKVVDRIEKAIGSVR